MVNAHIDSLDNPDKFKNNKETINQEVPKSGLLNDGKFKNLTKTKSDQ